MKKPVAIAPTVTTDDIDEYREQLDLISSYSDGVHLDYADGEFAPTKMLPINKTWRSDSIITHAHVMFKDPFAVIDDIIALDADLVVLHVESENLKKSLQKLHDNGTRAGVALLVDTTVDDLKKLGIDGLFEHVLVFGGRLGYQGGSADLTMLDKVKEVIKEYPDVEIGWDGGANGENAAEIAAAGVTVINMGGFFKKAEDPKRLYAALKAELNS